MESDGRTEDGREDGQSADVLHFPRDWFGPPEELVPFGPRAHAADELELRRRGPVGLRPAEVLGGALEDPPQTGNLDEAPAPDDFWGEHSAQIQGAVEGPRRMAVDVGPGPISAPRSPRPARAQGWRAPSRRLVQGAAWGGAVLVCAAAAIGQLGSAASRARVTAPAASGRGRVS